MPPGSAPASEVDGVDFELEALAVASVGYVTSDTETNLAAGTRLRPTSA